jgi:translation elongation factor EF-1beta
MAHGDRPLAEQLEPLKNKIYKRIQKKIMKKKIKLQLTEKIQQQKTLQKKQVRDLVKSKLAEADAGYTQNAYQILLRVALSKDHGGTRDETENEVRAITGVGTVKTQAGSTRQDGANYYADILVKFYLLGKTSVVQYLRGTLLPAMRRIEGLSVLRLGRYEDLGTSTRIREWSDAFIGNGREPGQSKGRATPTPTIDAIAQDWLNTGKDGMGIKASELAHSVADITMVPVEELMRYLGTNYYSATYVEFEDEKKRIINAGVKNPVHVAIGKNGRVRITSGDDTVLAAKDIGLKELPTVFSLQLQV